MSEARSIVLWWWRRDRDREVAEAERRVSGNLVLTSWGGLLLVPLLAVVGLTGAVFGDLWRAHFFAGFMLVPLLGMKLATTGYRAVRYYAHSRAYRAAGPPIPLARVLGPVLVASTVVAMVSGIVMWAAHDQVDPWGTVHTDSVAVLAVAAGTHLLLHLPRALRALSAERRDLSTAPGQATGRAVLVVMALIAGIGVGLATEPLSQWPVRSHREYPVGLAR